MKNCLLFSICIFLLLGIILQVHATRKEKSHLRSLHRRQAEDEFEDEFEYEDEEEPLIEEEPPRHKPSNHQAPEPTRNEDKIPATKPAPAPKNSTTLYSRLFATRRPRPPPPRPADKPKPTLPSFIRSRPRLEGSKFSPRPAPSSVSKTTTTTTTTTPRPSRSGTTRNGKGGKTSSSRSSTVSESTTEGPRRRFGKSSGPTNGRTSLRTRGNAS